MKLGNVLALVSIFFLGIGAGILIKSYFTSDAPDKKVLSLSQGPSPTPSAVGVQGLDDDISGIRVAKIIDGDTFVLASGQTVRLIGIDAPEKNDCFATESTSELSNLIGGKNIRLEKDVSETDRYRRLLRYIWVDQTFVDDQLVRRGFATAKDYPPDSKYKEQFAQAEVEARINNRGLWGACSVDQSAGQSVSEASDRDCGDFKTHAEAQAFFSAAGPGDPHKLDSDGDGLACESLP